MINPSLKVRRLAAAEMMRAKLYARGFAARLLIYLVAVGFALIGVAMLVVASYLVFSETYGGPVGAVMASGIVFILAILLVVFVNLLSGRQARIRADEEAKEAKNDLSRDTALVMALLDGYSFGSGGKGKPKAKTIALAALAVGLVVGLGPVLQKFMAKQD